MFFHYCLCFQNSEMTCQILWRYRNMCGWLCLSVYVCVIGRGRERPSMSKCVCVCMCVVVCVCVSAFCFLSISRDLVAFCQPGSHHANNIANIRNLFFFTFVAFQLFFPIGALFTSRHSSLYSSFQKHRFQNQICAKVKLWTLNITIIII